MSRVVQSTGKQQCILIRVTPRRDEGHQVLRLDGAAKAAIPQERTR